MSDHACTSAGCGKPATLQCPTCRQLGILSDTVGRFCSESCFESSWRDHKLIHQSARKLQCSVDSTDGTTPHAIAVEIIDDNDDCDNIDLVEEDGNINGSANSTPSSTLKSVEYRPRKGPQPLVDEDGLPYLQNYFNWREVYPQLQILYDNQDVLLEEAKTVGTWIPWPEDHYSKQDGVRTDWTVFPFLHTFPAYDASRMKWVGSTNAHCPRTSALLKQIPGIRTALFSKLGPKTKLSLHTGWEDLANHVLRCHINLDIPSTGKCGMYVDGEVRYHEQGEILVFDDSKSHGAFNDSVSDSRVILIVDMLRPEDLPKGRAKGGHTAELDKFVDSFR